MTLLLMLQAHFWVAAIIIDKVLESTTAAALLMLYMASKMTSKHWSPVTFL